MMAALYIFLLMSIVAYTTSQTTFNTNHPPNINQQQFFDSNNVIQKSVPNYGDNQLARSAIQKPIPNYGGSPIDETNLNSSFISQFAAYNLKAQKEAGVYPRLYDITFPPEDIPETFYKELVYFANQMGLHEVGSLPQRVTDAAVQLLSNSTPLEVFKIISNTVERALENEGILTEDNYEVLARMNAKALKDAMDLIKVDDARSTFHAIIAGGESFFKLLSITDIEYIMATLAELLSKVNIAPVNY